MKPNPAQEGDAVEERVQIELTVDELEAVIHVLTAVRDDGPGLSQLSGPALKKLGHAFIRSQTDS